MNINTHPELIVYLSQQFSIKKNNLAQLPYADAPWASFLLQHFCSILLSRSVVFVELVLINANANAKPAPLSVHNHKRH